MKSNTIPVCLTVAGSDSSGGAGIQADLKTFEYFNVFGASVITAVTAQNPMAVKSIHPIPATEVKSQLKAVFDTLNITAIKTGMLYSVDIISSLLEFLEQIKYRFFLVVDPVMVAGCGASLSNDATIDTHFMKLLKRSNLVTPNIPEAELLLNKHLSFKYNLIEAVKELADKYQSKFLLKGGHSKSDNAIDYFSDGSNVYEFVSPHISANCTHGTGCRLSSAIAANISKGENILDAIRLAKSYINQSIAQIEKVGKNCFALGQPHTIDIVGIKINRIYQG